MAGAREQFEPGEKRLAKEPRRVTDMVNQPPHYNQGGVECIDAIEAALGPVGFIEFLRGQIIKYNWRLGLKGPATEDAKKAQWYQNKLVAALEKQRVD